VSGRFPSGIIHAFVLNLSPLFLLKKTARNCYHNPMSDKTATSQNPAKGQSQSGIRHTPTTAPETLRAFTGKCGTVRGQIKAPFMEKCFSPKATGIRQQATGNRQQATGNRQQATGNRQQATGIRQQASGIRHQASGIRQLYTSFK
jgi:uncharacterized protein YjbJ (UPF0337 family)